MGEFAAWALLSFAVKLGRYLNCSCILEVSRGRDVVRKGEGRRKESVKSPLSRGEMCMVHSGSVGNGQ